jgi:hypothetical protein
MMKLPMTRAASGLLRAILGRAGAESDRILLSEISSVDWRSLTLEGERHEIQLRIAGAGAQSILDSLREGLEDAEFQIPGQIVADIVLAGGAVPALDGSLTVTLEALTIAE